MDCSVCGGACTHLASLVCCPHHKRHHAPRPAAPLSPRAQELFLDQASFTAQVGVELMAGSMRHAVVRAAGTLGLKQPMSAAALSGVVETAMAEFARMVAGVGLVAFLLPSPEQLQANLASHRPVGAPLPEAVASVEGSVVAMMDELRGAVAGPLFAQAMAVWLSFACVL